MAKKKKSAQESKASTKAAKKAKADRKTEKTEKKKSKYKEEEDDDLESILENMRREWEETHAVTEELVEGPPSRRANATLTACPSGNYLWCIGGEYFSDDKKAHFYNDVFRYSPEKDDWRRFVSKICPGPRSAHAVAVTPAGGGRLFLFGGEFSSLNQNTFHHYRDFWCFNINSHTWDRIDTKTPPSARSGHRMAVWKHFIVLFGGFYDPGITTRYHNDLWVFDTQDYKWEELKFAGNELRPSPRSGFSFLSTPDGIVLHGGYCKEYVKGKRPVGVMLDDTWFLNMTLKQPIEGSSKATDDLKVKWERKKHASTAYIPARRSGATMALWINRAMGVQFGGVTDEDTSEETLESVFWNDLNGYTWTGKGRWVSLTLKKPKKAKQDKKKKNWVAASQHFSDGDDQEQDDWDNNLRLDNVTAAVASAGEDRDPNDPALTIPIPRYNAMLAVLRNTLYIYGGIFERGSREYTLDDFYSLDLEKMERFVCLKESGVSIDEDDEESDSEDDSEGGSEDDADEDTVVGDGDDDVTIEGHPMLGNMKIIEEEEEHKKEAEPEVVDELRERATQFMGVAKDSARTPEDVLSTPLPGETLAMFYARSRDFWAQAAYARDKTDTRGKQLRRDGFVLAQEKYAEYKPVLLEVEKILTEAGLDEEEMRLSAAAGPLSGSTQNRNRR